MAIFKRNHLFQTLILGIHVIFRGCTDLQKSSRFSRKLLFLFPKPSRRLRNGQSQKTLKQHQRHQHCQCLNHFILDSQMAADLRIFESSTSLRISPSLWMQQGIGVALSPRTAGASDTMNVSVQGHLVMSFESLDGRSEVRCNKKKRTNTKQKIQRRTGKETREKKQQKE